MSEAPAPPPAKPPAYAIATAAALLVLYIVLTLAMIVLYAEKTGTYWEHVLLVYNGFTAFAVSAGGVLLGTQIQQVNVAAARRDAAAAATEADRVKQAAREALVATEPDPSLTAAVGAVSPSDLSRVRALLLKAL